MQLDSVLCLPALLEAETWDQFGSTLVAAVRDSFAAKRAYLVLPSDSPASVAIYAEAVVGQRALAFAEPQHPSGFFGVPVEELAFDFAPERLVRSAQAREVPVEVSEHLLSELISALADLDQNRHYSPPQPRSIVPQPQQYQRPTLST